VAGKKKKLIALDVDGVIMDFMTQFLRVHNERYNTRITRDDITSFMPHGSVAELITESEWDESFAWFEDNGGYATLEALEGARTALQAILDAGHEIVFVTARHSKFKGETEMSFILNKLPLKKIYFAPRGKTARLKAIKPDIFVDDSLKNCLQAKKAGVKEIYVLDSPYNRTEEANEFKRIGNLIQLERELVEDNKE